ncbi:glycosyltransferase family 2 protein [Methylobacterium currus]|uniref:Glycosyltransferase family 2 protein n=2 Tax=Methylobacterium currus TaxID=2051553 RepID=A0A2R4WQ28_9HYPH|nr:glycosyltransferase family 2 protein [Methylobacterium currus]
MRKSILMHSEDYPMSDGTRGVLIAVPVLNEEYHLRKCIQSLLDQDFEGDTKIVVIDGGSTDRTREIAHSLSRQSDRIYYIDNPGRIQSKAINLAARSNLPGDILVRADAHADYGRDFVRNCVSILVQGKAETVVVPMRTVGRRPFQRAVAAAQNSLLGNGGAAHRRNATSRFVDHGHHAAFRREFFLALGGYDETFTHNEDAEFDLRARAAGGRVWLCAEAVITYYPRAKIGSLSRQYFNYGRGRARNMLMHRSIPKLRQVAPLFITLTSLVCIVGALLYPPSIVLPLAYGAVYCLWSFAATLRTRDPAVLAMGVAAAAMHISWSAGFLKTAADVLLARHTPA